MTTEKPKQLQKAIDFIAVFSNCAEQISKLAGGYNRTETKFNELIGFVEDFFFGRLAKGADGRPLRHPDCLRAELKNDPERS